MSKRRQQTAFLKALIRYGNLDERTELQERIKRAERDELCAWRALCLVSLLAVFSAFGICYSAVLIPGFFQNSSHIVVKVFFSLGLASVTCAVAFLGCWLWCRAVLNRVQQECRCCVMAMLEPVGRTNFSQFHPSAQDEEKDGAQMDVEGRGEKNDSTLLPSCQSYSQLFSLRRIS